MIVTVTPNPSVDRTFELEHLARGEVNRATSVHEHPGGKGINVSRALARHGVPTVAVLPVGGASGTRLVQALGALGVAVVAVPVAGETRTNVTLVEADGTTTKINATGPSLSEAEVAALLDGVERILAGGAASAVVVAGSLPAGATDDLYPRLAALVAARGLPLVVDTSGPALRRAVAAGGIALLKPNDDELAELVGRQVTTVGEVVAAAREVSAAGHVRELLVSLGSHGALLVTPDDLWWAGGPPVVPVSTVGAGDTALAGYLAASGTPDARLRSAVAWGRAAVLSPGSAAPAPSDVHIEDVRVMHRPDPNLSVKEL